MVVKKSIKLWWEDRIEPEMAYDFFLQLRESTSIFINRNTNIQNFPNSPTVTSKFVPKGAVIHTSGLRTIKQTLESNNSGAYSSHFIVMGNAYDDYKKLIKKYPLVGALPVSVVMPFDINTYLPHSGYLSPVTWGIELRNLGMIRPSEENFASTLTPADINDNNFKLWKRKSLYYYWKEHNWTSPYSGSAYTWQGYHYEKPSYEQIITSFVILKCLDSIAEINPALVLPSSAVTGEVPNIPIYPIDLVHAKLHKRTKNLYFKLKKAKLDKLKPLFCRVSQVRSELDDYDDDENLIKNHINDSLWRGEKDSGKLAKVFKHGDVKFVNLYRYKKIVESLGYCTKPEYFTKSLQLYANARNVDLNEEVLEVELEKDFYRLVNGAYDE